MPVYLDNVDLDFSDYTIDGYGSPIYSSFMIDDVWIDFVTLQDVNLQLRIVHELTGKQMVPSGTTLFELYRQTAAAMDTLDNEAYIEGEVSELTDFDAWLEWSEDAIRHIFSV